MHEHNKHIINNCIAGVCSKCGECCTDFFPITLKELQTLKEFIKENNIELTEWTTINPVTLEYETHVLCPLLDKNTRLCKAYPARPNICRTFKCCKDPQVVFKERDTIAKSAKYNNIDNHTGYITNVHSLYELLTGNKDKTIQLILSLVQSKINQNNEFDIDKVLYITKNIFKRDDITKEDILKCIQKEGI